jgi:preprotein translocase subunit SecY
MSVKGVGDALASFLANIPMVERPRRHVPLRTKLVFTIAILILYFALSIIELWWAIANEHTGHWSDALFSWDYDTGVI